MKIEEEEEEEEEEQATTDNYSLESVIYRYNNSTSTETFLT